MQVQDFSIDMCRSIVAVYDVSLIDIKNICNNEIPIVLYFSLYCTLLPSLIYHLQIFSFCSNLSNINLST